MAEIYTVRSILGDESLQNFINEGKSKEEIINIAKAYKDEALKSGDIDALSKMNLVSQKQGRADFFTRLGDKLDANGYESLAGISRGVDILASKVAAPIAGLVGDSDKEAQFIADARLTQSINEAKKIDEIATTGRTQKEYKVDSNNLLANVIGSYANDSQTYARNLIEEAQQNNYTAMDRLNIGMATTANATKYLIKSFFYGEDSKEAKDIKEAQKILEASRDAYRANNPDKWNIAGFAGEMITDPLNAVGLAKGFKIANSAFKKGANVAFDLAQLGAIGGMAGAISEYGSYKDKDEQNIAGAAMMGAASGVALGAGFMALGAGLAKIASRFGNLSTLEKNAQIAKDETAKEMKKGTPQDANERLQKISDDIEEAFGADENGQNIARLLGQEYDDNINEAIKQSEEATAAIDSSVAKFANDNPNASASDIEIYINKAYAPSQNEKELTRIINGDKPVTPRMAGYRVLGVLQKTMEYKTRFDRDTVVKRFKNHGFSDELANVFADAYTADDISVARKYLDSKVASNRDKSVDEGRNEWLEIMSATKDEQAAHTTRQPKQEQIYNDITSKDMPFHLIDDIDMTPQLQSRLEKDGYTLERESESGVWEISKASDKIAKDEVKSDGFVASDDNIKDLVKNISLNKDIAMQLQPKADLLNLAKDFSKVIKTPIFDSKISIDKLLNHLADKNSDKRLEYLNLIKPTLENPLFITKENNRYRFVKTFIDSDKITKFLSVIENDNGEFIGITATPIKNTDLKNLLKGDIVWGGDTLSTLNAPQIAKQEVEAISETIPNQDLKSADVANVSDEIGINKNRSGDLDRLQRKQLKNYEKDGAIAGTPAPATTRPNDGVEGEIIKNRTNAETIPNQNIKEAENLTQYRKDIEAKYNIKPIKEFGTNYAEFYHDGKGAIDKLLVEKQGQVAGAFHKDGRDITISWGEAKISNGDIKGYGLSKIEAKHLDDFAIFEGKTPQEKMTNGINEIIEKGKIVSDNGIDTIWYKKGDSYFLVGLSKGFKGVGDDSWIVTSYKKTNISENKKAEISEVLNGSGNSKTLSAYAEIKSSKTPELTTAENSTTTTNKSQGLNLSRAERRAMGIEEPKGKTLVIDEKAVKNDVREFGRLAHQVGLGFKSAKEAKAVMDKCDKSKFDCGS